MKAFLLAAGLGTRLLPHTANKPKCLIEVGGKPLLLWQAERLKSFGIKHLLINLFHEGQQIEINSTPPAACERAPTAPYHWCDCS